MNHTFFLFPPEIPDPTPQKNPSSSSSSQGRFLPGAKFSPLSWQKEAVGETRVAMRPRNGGDRRKQYWHHTPTPSFPSLEPKVAKAAQYNISRFPSRRIPLLLHQFANWINSISPLFSVLILRLPPLGANLVRLFLSLSFLLSSSSPAEGRERRRPNLEWYGGGGGREAQRCKTGHMNNAGRNLGEAAHDNLLHKKGGAGLSFPPSPLHI